MLKKYINKQVIGDICELPTEEEITEMKLLKFIDVSKIACLSHDYRIQFSNRPQFWILHMVFKGVWLLRLHFDKLKWERQQFSYIIIPKVL